MYKNLKIERLVLLLEDWKKRYQKNLKDNLEFKLDSAKYWEGKIDTINEMLEVINIFK